MPKSPVRRRSGHRSCKQEKIKKVMHEYKIGTLRSSSGQKVKKRKQAIAIALSVACSPREMSGGAKILSGLNHYYFK